MVIKDIKDGWLNYMILKIESMTTRLRLSDKFKKEVETRSNICRSCPSLSISSKKIFGAKCGHCGCSFPALVFSQKKRCPIGKWVEFDSDVYK
tara:strand:- start:88 stop:366 length:279 start_codon:yes stop_codon:yes gene_type:complete